MLTNTKRKNALPKCGEDTAELTWWRRLAMGFDYEALLANNGVICALMLSIAMGILYTIPAEELAVQDVRCLIHYPNDADFGNTFRKFVVSELEAQQFNFTIQVGHFTLDAKSILLDSSTGAANALPVNPRTQSLLELEAVASVIIPKLDIGRMNAFVLLSHSNDIGKNPGASLPSGELVSIGTSVTSLLSASMLGSMVTYMSFALGGANNKLTKQTWSWYGLPATILSYLLMMGGLFYFYFFLLVVGRVRFPTFSLHAFNHEAQTLFIVIMGSLIFSAWMLAGTIRTWRSQSFVIAT
jgi:hypothetical protein